MVPALQAVARLDALRLTPGQRIRRAQILDYYFGREKLLSFIARTAPHEPPPPHLRKLIAIFQRCRTERVRACVSMPPRAGKSITIKRALAWWLSISPCDLNCYASYNSDFAEDQSREARDIAAEAGVRLASTKNTAAHWLTAEGGGVFSAGLNAGITGRGVGGILVVDDPYANPGDARSPTIRRNVKANFNQVAKTRLEGDASVVVVHTRWHPEDLIGELEREGWEYLNIPAVALANDPLGRVIGEPLWPERPQFTTEALEEIRHSDEYGFAALYQGQPIAEGAKIFYGPACYWDPRKTDLSSCRVVIGVDPAATAKTSADFSAAFALAIKPPFTNPVVYVLDGYRRQVTIPQLCRDLQAFQQRNYRAPLKVESVAGFKAVPQLLKEMAPNLQIDEITPFGDKRQRAELVASAWNDGRFLLPLTDPHLKDAKAQPPWVPELIREMQSFTGVGDGHDDQVDACAHGYNSLAIAGAPPPRRQAVLDPSRFV